MAKYVDIDACGRYLFGKIGFSTVSLETVLDHMADYADHNSADVVTRAEVAKIFEEIDRMIYKVLNDRHYIMGDMCYEVAELKKKYTEEGK